MASPTTSYICLYSTCVYTSYSMLCCTVERSECTCAMEVVLYVCIFEHSVESAQSVFIYLYLFLCIHHCSGSYTCSLLPANLLLFDVHCMYSLCMYVCSVTRYWQWESGGNFQGSQEPPFNYKGNNYCKVKYCNVVQEDELLYTAATGLLSC